MSTAKSMPGRADAFRSPEDLEAGTTPDANQARATCSVLAEALAIHPGREPDGAWYRVFRKADGSTAAELVMPYRYGDPRQREVSATARPKPNRQCRCTEVA